MLSALPLIIKLNKHIKLDKEKFRLLINNLIECLRKTIEKNDLNVEEVSSKITITIFINIT